MTTDCFINECNIVIIEENNDSETNDNVTTADRTRDGDNGSANANLKMSLKRFFFVVNIHYPTKVTNNMII